MRPLIRIIFSLQSIVHSTLGCHGRATKLRVRPRQSATPKRLHCRTILLRKPASCTANLFISFRTIMNSIHRGWRVPPKCSYGTSFPGQRKFLLGMFFFLLFSIPSVSLKFCRHVKVDERGHFQLKGTFQGPVTSLVMEVKHYCTGGRHTNHSLYDKFATSERAHTVNR